MRERQSETSSVKQILDFKINVSKEQEELQARLTKLKQSEIPDLQEVLALKARLAEKEIERAKVSSSCGSSLRSISSIGTPEGNLRKVSGLVDKTEEAENVAQPINVPSVYPQTSVIKPGNTVLSMHGGEGSAQAKDLKSSLNPVKSTEAAVRDIKRTEQKLTMVLAVKQQQHNQK